MRRSTIVATALVATLAAQGFPVLAADQCLGTASRKARIQGVQSSGPKIASYAVVPVDEAEFAKVFGYSPSQPERDQMVHARKKLEAGSEVVFSRPVQAQTQLGAILDGDAQMMVLLGHNERGRFYLADGTSVSIEKLARRCNAKGKLCVFLSCESGDYLHGVEGIGLRRQREFRELVDYRAELINQLRDLNHIDANDVRAILDSIEVGSDKRKRVEVVTMAVAGSLVVVAIVVIICDSSTHPNAYCR
jgi:hypothetical protein